MNHLNYQKCVIETMNGAYQNANLKLKNEEPNQLPNIYHWLNERFMQECQLMSKY